MANIRGQEIATKKSTKNHHSTRLVVPYLQLTRALDVEAARQFGIVGEDFAPPTFPVRITDIPKEAARYIGLPLTDQADLPPRVPIPEECLVFIRNLINETANGLRRPPRPQRT